MTLACTVPAPDDQSAGGVVAVVAPDGPEPDLGLARAGWSAIAVRLPLHTLPLSQTDECPAEGAFSLQITHETMRRTLNALRTRQVSAVVAGSPAGVDLADQLATCLGLPANCPATAVLRRDRQAQGAALTHAGLPSVRGMHTESLAAAVSWARFVQFPEYVLAPADTSTPGARICRTPDEISLAWPHLRRTAYRHSGDQHLVLCERLPGAQYVVHTLTGPGPSGGAEHTVTDIWASTRTAAHQPDRMDLVPPTGLLPRALTVYLRPVLDQLGVTTGAFRSRIVYTPDRGPILLSTRAVPGIPAGHRLPGSGRAFSYDYARPRHQPQLHVARVSLIAPADGLIDGCLLRMLTALATVTRVDDALRPGAPVTRTTDRATSPGELVLAADDVRALDADYRAIRRVEARGLYQGSAR
ncbi:hypothetical protein [Streptomyces chattanoogensis]|uniref:hypothetical protein n=1 Tax=Streptomyces chattanoogensis TaxID=66876 RepID=UPI0036A9B6FB